VPKGKTPKYDIWVQKYTSYGELTSSKAFNINPNAPRINLSPNPAKKESTITVDSNQSFVSAIFINSIGQSIQKTVL
jgi:hypothetical protein